MKATIAEYPMIGDVEAKPWAVRVAPQPKASVVTKTAAPATTWLARSVVIASGGAMIYVLVCHGQIFQNYLQW
jgi:hypothetical protein